MDCGKVYKSRGMKVHQNACVDRCARLRKEACQEGKMKQVNQMLKSNKVDAYYVLSSAGISDSVIDSKYGLMLLD